MSRPLPPLLLLVVLAASAQTPVVYLVPNTHGTVSGWLVDFDTERNYVLNNYLAHLDRINQDPAYRLAYSEVPNLISLLQFAPQRLEELKQRIRERKVELTNGFFLEPDVNLSSGEALVQMGVQGLRWYEKFFGLRPRHCWMIDLTGCHRQMPQIVAGLGMDDIVYCRNNPTKQAVYWWQSPDGSRVLAINDSHYAQFGLKEGIFTARGAVPPAAIARLRQLLEMRQRRTPSASSQLALMGNGDYSLPPVNPASPSAFLTQWRGLNTGFDLRFAIAGDYLQAIQRETQSGRTRLATFHGDTGYTWEAFWMNMPEVKLAYRQSETLLTAAELYATATAKAYPAQDFYNAWINLLMNMDRNIIWGAAAGTAFKDTTHWDAWDRFQFVRQHAHLAPSPNPTFLNALNWTRTDPVELDLPPGQAPAKATCEQTSRLTCVLNLPPASATALKLVSARAPAPKSIPLPARIDTPYYAAVIDPASGALISLKVKPTGQELLGGPANEVLMERAPGDGEGSEHFMAARPKRVPVGSSRTFQPKIDVTAGPLSTLVEVSSGFSRGSKLVRQIRFYRNHPRIDFTTTLDLASSGVLVSVDFPLAGPIAGRARGIPYGFADGMAKESVLPAVRWSNYQLSPAAGLALLDQGLPAHELNPNTVTLILLNAVPRYMKLPNPMLEGTGRREFRYALVPHAGSWQEAAIPRRAYEFNAPLYRVGTPFTTLLDTSANVIVEAVRRVGDEIEVRLYETNGEKGTASVKLNRPYLSATRTNLLGETPLPLRERSFEIRPQQIVTLRFKTEQRAPLPVPLENWTALVPPGKRAALNVRLTGTGHPGRD
ncbi:MAG: hypothetical protein IT160_03900 [Bryobacterales bacterium]|nr:hypothetical protein [Bryobacterales bacterium]